MLFISRSSVHRFGLCFERHSQTSIYRPAAIQISALNTAHAFFSSDRIPKAARSCTTNNLTEPVHPEDTHAKSNTYNIRDTGTSDKYFDFKKIEYTTYAWWHNSGYFQPSANSQLPVFTVPMPPPNVTGYLHMGHALFVSLQDIMARYQRMRGRATLWLPGTDHAGIATQLLVEKHLKAEGLSRQSLGREKFLKRVWQWKQEKGDYIVEQMKRLGASADWSRHKFTLDEDMSASVVEAFVNLHEKGLIYRDTYMVNWSPGLQTSISDLEVDYNEEESLLYTFKYPLLPTSGDKLLPKASHMEFIPISTTRPETILGDAAIMIHPDDERYKHLIGRCAVVPMTNGRTIPVLADTYVDMTFGTGALKITPAHDLQDYELGKKYNLEVLNIFHKDASMNTKEAMNMHSQRPANNEIAISKYEGMDRFQCRAELWKDLQQMGLAVGTTPHVARVPRSQRGGEIIEPLVSRQWFVKMDHMAEQAVTAVHTGQLKIIPNRFEKMWHNWLTNIRPWCISRQLWWGHRIPVYYVENRSEEEYIVARTEREAYEKARQKYPADAAAGTLRLRQEDDVLDTWFR